MSFTKSTKKEKIFLDYKTKSIPNWLKPMQKSTTWKSCTIYTI